MPTAKRQGLTKQDTTMTTIILGGGIGGLSLGYFFKDKRIIF